MVPGPWIRGDTERESTAARLGDALAFWAIAFFCIFLLFASYWIPAARKLGALQAEEKDIDAEIAVLRKENTDLERSLNALYNDPYFVEMILRREHGFHEEGEKAIRPRLVRVGE